MPNATTIAATIRADGSATLEVDGRVESIATTRHEDARREIVHRAALAAASLGTSVPVTVVEPDAAVHLLVGADGSMTVIEDVPAPVDAASGATVPPSALDVDAAPSAPHLVPPTLPVPHLAPATLPAPLYVPDMPPVPQAVPQAHVVPPVPPAPVAAPREATPEASGTLPPTADPEAASGVPEAFEDLLAPADPDSSPEALAGLLAPEDTEPAGTDARLATRRSFLQHETVEKPATKGWRGALVGLGVRVSPSAQERAERADLRAVSQHWPGPRTIAVVNGKGGAGKTPTTINLAAVFARHGGAGVLAWDNNQTRGTLGWRTEKGPHDSTLLELLPQTDRLLGTSAQSADLASFVHHQTADKYDVLRSKPAVLASEQRITAADVSSIHAVAAKYYRLIVIDSGNDETDPLWLQMVDHADQLVIATTTRDDHAEAGALLLEALAERDARSAQLASEAVAVVTQADSKATDADIRHVADGFRAIAREVVTIPFDPTLVDGIITFEALRPATRRAWLAAAAAIARGL
ncbi:AAA family ATPase [Microbacterium sp. SYP-A9085]|uniref:AAA family ATPase n=1 Tax=Microbacterium sp. SYP-A9085 TaxID=2664454 RepID=UPI00129A327A|nr:AAA family ATPase [Microbacterium sp. SYP-A9085]MRH28372.1 AAA family ATPase [Microbacterium sp. SYP-A9085]